MVRMSIFPCSLLIVPGCLRKDFEPLPKDRIVSQMDVSQPWISDNFRLTGLEQYFSHYISTRRPNLDIGSQAAFREAKSWLSSCVENHTKCQIRYPSLCPEMPSRVLEILCIEDNEYSVKLIDNSGQTSPYVALSYIWGVPQEYQTLGGNIDKFKQEINARKLPKTILDAIRCTHELGLRYLWVDTLCIIQDSQEGKAKEIGRMSGIYKNTHVAISAASVKKCMRASYNLGEVCKTFKRNPSNLT